MCDAPAACRVPCFLGVLCLAGPYNHFTSSSMLLNSNCAENASTKLGIPQCSLYFDWLKLSVMSLFMIKTSFFDEK